MRWHDEVAFDRALRRLSGLELIYLHGRFDDPVDKIILGEKSYRQAYEHPGAINERLKAVCQTNTLLLVGSSLQDEDMMGVLRFTLAIGKQRAPHYTIIGLEPGTAPEEVAAD